ncbi:lysis system i-spanin subunit Rz [Kosakonia cowanii]|uniref:lysis system i-spanin subunit Rz n=1 Tax=Kosakonia cowanii TaxID=208223 RepID=UPI003B985791
MKVRQRNVVALDAKYIGAKADAKTTFDQLRDDVANDELLLRLNARCSAKRASGMGDASSH